MVLSRGLYREPFAKRDISGNHYCVFAHPAIPGQAFRFDTRLLAGAHEEQSPCISLREKRGAVKRPGQARQAVVSSSWYPHWIPAFAGMTTLLCGLVYDTVLDFREACA